MGDEDARTNLAEQGGDRIRVHLRIDRPHVRGHLAEVLVEGLRIARELHAWEEVGPDAEPEGGKPVLLVRRRWYRPINRASPRPATARLVHEIDPEAAPQEDRLIALTAVRRRLPRLRKLADAVPHDQGQAPGPHRHLVEDIGVIAVQCLPAVDGAVPPLVELWRRRHRDSSPPSLLRQNCPAARSRANQDWPSRMRYSTTESAGAWVTRIVWVA